MASHKHQVQVGVAFLLSIAVLVAGVMWFRDFRIGGRYQQVEVVFPSTSGLLEGDPVEAHGVPAGEVEEIRFEKGRPIVTLKIDEEVTLRGGARFAIENVGIMGQKLVSIDTGRPEAAALPADTTLHGSYQPGISQVVAGAGESFATLERLAARIDSLLVVFDDQGGESVMTSLENAARVTGELAGFLSDNREDLSRSIEGFSNSVAALERALVGHEDDLGMLIERSASSAARLDSSLVAWERTVSQVDSLLVETRAGEGTLGRMATDPALYDETLEAVRETRILIQEIRENPGAFVDVSLF